MKPQRRITPRDDLAMAPLATFTNEEVVVTNHPKRSWFAQLGRKNGRL